MNVWMARAWVVALAGATSALVGISASYAFASSPGTAEGHAAPPKLWGPSSDFFGLSGRDCWAYGICVQNIGGVTRYCIKIPKSLIPAQRKERCFGRDGRHLDTCGQPVIKNFLGGQLVGADSIIVCQLWVRQIPGGMDREFLPRIILTEAVIEVDATRLRNIGKPECPNPKVLNLPLVSKRITWWDADRGKFGRRNEIRVRCPGMR
jgi:hypothetical protein